MPNARPRLRFDTAAEHIELVMGRRDAVCVFQIVPHLERAHYPRPIVLIGTLGEHGAALERHNQQGAAIFLQLNAAEDMTSEEEALFRRPEKTATEIRVLCADDDGTNVTPNLKLPATMTLQTSSGERNRHFYFAIDPGVSIEEFEGAQKHLALALGTDRAISGRRQCMRLAGTWNMKRDPFQVRILEHVNSRIYPLDELLAAHPIPDDLAKETPSISPPSIPHEDPNEALPPEAQAAADDIVTILTNKKIEFSRKGPGTFSLRKCVLNPTHIDTLMIRVFRSGGYWAGCFHDTCGANSQIWSRVKEHLGIGRSPLIFARGDHPEIARRLLTDLRHNAPEPIVHAEGAFHRYNALTGLWEPIPESEAGRYIAGYAGLRKGSGSRQTTLKLKGSDRSGILIFAEDLAKQETFFLDAPVGIAFTNGYLHMTETGCVLRPHAPENRAKVGLPYPYEPEAQAPRWNQYLQEVFAGDEDINQKIALLQEFSGICLVAEAWRYQSVVLLVGEGSNGKALALDTPIPTPTGWTTQGALRVGDEVFNEKGRPCRVIGLSPIWTNRPCYKVIFSDGTSVVADAEHDWHVRSYAGRWSRRTTREIATSLIAHVRFAERFSKNGVIPRIKEHRWSTPVTEALRPQTKTLPIDPYVLGIWLGDGTSRAAQIACANENLPHFVKQIETAGYFVRSKRRDTKTMVWRIGISTQPQRGWRGTDSLQSRLRSAKLLSNKHIPAQYLRASFTQRLALLQGLMDTDGSTLATQAQCEFMSTNRTLAKDVLELLRTLGLRPTFKESRALLYGRDIGPKFRMLFTTPPGFMPFRLPSKVKRCRPRKSPLFRKIIACEPSASVPVRCIQVSSPSHLYLCGEGFTPTHNSIFIDIITSLFPEKFCAAIKPQDLGHEYSRAALVNVRLNAVSEIPEADILASDSFKEIVDGKLIMARQPYGRQFTCRPRAGHIFSANRLPGTVDYTHAFFRRFLIVLYNRRFEGANRDEHLEDRLKLERAGIIAWAVLGAARLREQGKYTMPLTSTRALAAWKHEADAISLFLTQCTTPDPTGPGISKSLLYTAVRDWLQRNGYRAMNSQTVLRRLRGLGVSAGTNELLPLKLTITIPVWN